MLDVLGARRVGASGHEDVAVHDVVDDRIPLRVDGKRSEPIALVVNADRRDGDTGRVRAGRITTLDNLNPVQECVRMLPGVHDHGEAIVGNVEGDSHKRIVLRQSCGSVTG